MKLLTKELQESYENEKICYTDKVRNHCEGAAHSIFYLEYTVPKKNSFGFWLWIIMDYHFIMKELAEEKNLLT